MKEKIHPFKQPTANVRGEWRSNPQEWWWCINDEWVSDKDLRNWIYANIDYPHCYADVIRQFHCNAWANRRLTPA